MGFPGGSEGKASACNAGGPGLIPASGRSPGKGNGNPLQYSCLENPMDRRAWRATVHGVAKSQTRLSNFTFFLLSCKQILGIPRKRIRKVTWILWRAFQCRRRFWGWVLKTGGKVGNRGPWDHAELTHFCSQPVPLVLFKHTFFLPLFPQFTYAPTHSQMTSFFSFIVMLLTSEQRMNNLPSTSAVLDQNQKHWN